MLCSVARVQDEKLTDYTSFWCPHWIDLIDKSEAVLIVEVVSTQIELARKVSKFGKCKVLRVLKGEPESSGSTFSFRSDRDKRIVIMTGGAVWGNRRNRQPWNSAHQLIRNGRVAIVAGAWSKESFELSSIKTHLPAFIPLSLKTGDKGIDPVAQGDGTRRSDFGR